MAVSSPTYERNLFLGFHDPSGASGPLFGADDVADDDQGRDIFGYTVRVKGVLLHVVENFSAHTEVVTLKWRSTPGSGSYTTIGTYTIPASTTAGSLLYRDFNENDNTETEIGAGGSVSEYGIAGSYSTAGEEDSIVGPGGEWQLADVGSSTAGQTNVWLVVEAVSRRSSPQTITMLAA